MTPEDFLKKWVEPAARGLKVLPENLRMKDDLEAVIRAENQALQNIIDRQAEDLRCFENQGHIDNWGEEMIHKSNWIQQATRGYRPETFDIDSRFAPDVLDEQDDHIEASPFCFPSPIKYGNDFGIKRPDNIIKPESPDIPSNEDLQDQQNSTCL